jgi:uncharacterized RDD family membrane protein YckC
MADPTHYDVIGADPRAAKADLKAAYAATLEQAQAAGDTDRTAAVRRAWQVLSDPVQRQRYDDEIGLTGRGSAASAAGGASAGETPVDGAGESAEAAAPDATATAGRLPSVLPGPSGVPDALEQPTLGRRLTASFIDVVTLLAGYVALTAVAYAVVTGDAARYAALIVLFEALVLGLFVIPTLRTGQTLGKRFTYIMCVDRETGHLPSVAQVVRRYVVPMVAVPALLQMGAFLALFFGLSYTMGRDQVSLADRIARTAVVVARYQPPRPARRA